MDIFKKGNFFIPVGARYFSLLQNLRTGSGAHLTSYSVGTEVLSRGYWGWGVVWTTHFHLVPRLRMSGAILLLLLCAFMAWTGAVLTFYILEETVYR